MNIMEAYILLFICQNFYTDSDIKDYLSVIGMNY